MKVLITGINGFAGQHLQRELDSRGIDVWGIDTWTGTEKITEVNILDKDQLEESLNRISPDYIIHLAAISSVDHSNSSHIYNVNFNGTLNLLSACSKMNPKPGFLFVSSSQVYGNLKTEQLPIDEKFPINPVNHYGASKAATEMAVKAFGKEYDLKYVIARPFNHTGPGQTDRFVVPKIINSFRRRDNSIELGNVDTIRDFLDVRDIARAYADIIGNFRNGEIYNIASGKGISILSVFNKIEDIAGFKMNMIKKDFLVRQNEIQSVVGNAQKLYMDTGWQPSIPLEQTLADMFNN